MKLEEWNYPVFQQMEVNMLVLGIDPSSNFIGLAIVEIDLKTFTPKIINTHCINLKSIRDFPDNKEPIYYKAYVVRKYMMNLLGEYAFDKVVYEKPFINRLFMNAFPPVNSITTVMLECIHSFDPTIAITPYSPKEIKKGVGDAKADKDKMKILVNNLDWVDINIDGISEHEIDALAVIHNYKNHFKTNKHNLI